MKVSVSLTKADLASLTKRARVAHDGNLSAAFAEAAHFFRQQDARSRLVAMLGGPILTPSARATIEAEQAPPKGSGRTKPRRKRAA